MTHDMKPIFRAKVVGPAATALLRPILTTDKRKYPNYHLQVLDEAPGGKRSGLCPGKRTARFPESATSWPPPPRSGVWRGR